MFRLALFFILCSPSILKAQAPLITWSATHPLTWNDFQSKEAPAVKWSDAITYFIVKDKINYCTTDSVDATVVAMFNPYKSWKKHDKLSTYLLKHEQGHFDIAELYARKIRREIALSKQSARKHHHTQLWFQNVYAQHIKQMHRCQRRYDRQTKHSQKITAQEAWNNRIAAELAELNLYAQ